MWYLLEVMEVGGSNSKPKVGLKHPTLLQTDNNLDYVLPSSGTTETRQLPA